MPLSPPRLGEYNIVCPYCKIHNLQLLKSDSGDVRCSSCSKDFHVFLATVRAKRGRGSDWVIRTVTHSGEGELRLYAGTSDLDLRSGDIMYVCYKIDYRGIPFDRPTILCNVTTNTYSYIETRPTTICEPSYRINIAKFKKSQLKRFK